MMVLNLVLEMAAVLTLVKVLTRRHTVEIRNLGLLRKGGIPVRGVQLILLVISCIRVAGYTLVLMSRG